MLVRQKRGGLIRENDARKMQVNLKLEDGTDFGNVSLSAYRAIQKGELDGFEPMNKEEEEVIEKYKKYAHPANQRYELKTRGVSHGYITNAAFEALKTGGVSHYVPKDNAEKEAIDSYYRWADKQLKTAPVFGEEKNGKYAFGAGDTLFGYVSNDAKIAIKLNRLGHYSPKDDEENAAIQAYNVWKKNLNGNATPPRKATLYETTVLSAQRGYYQNELGKEYFKEMMGLANNIEKYENILNDDKYNFASEGFIGEGVSGGAGIVGQWTEGITDPKTLRGGMAYGTAAAAMGNAAGVTIATPEELVTFPAGFLKGATASMAVQGGEVMAGFAYKEMVDAGIGKETAKLIALAVGGVSGALEAIELDEIIKAGKLLSKSRAKGSAWVAIKDYLKTLGIEVAKETAQEVAQEFTAITGVNIANSIEKGKPLYTGMEVWNRLDETARSSALAFGATNIGSGAVYYRVNKASNAKQTVELGKKYNQPETIEALIESGLESPEGTKLRKYAEIAKTKVETGKVISDAEIGRLVRANVEQIEAENLSYSRVKEVDSESGGVTITDKVNSENTAREIVKRVESENVKKLDASLKSRGVSDERRANIVSGFAKIESTLEGTGRSVAEVSNAVGKMTVVSAKALGENVDYWAVYDINVNALSSGVENLERNAAFVMGYAGEYAKALLINDPVAYKNLSKAGNVGDIIADYVLNGTIPKKIKPTAISTLAAAKNTLRKAVDTGAKQLGKVNTLLYGENGSASTVAAKNNITLASDSTGTNTGAMTSLNALQNDNTNDIITPTNSMNGSDISGEVDTGRSFDKNGDGYSEVQTGRETERVENRLSGRDIGTTGTLSTDRRNYGNIETRTLEALIDDNEFNRLTNFVGNEISKPIYYRLLDFYLADPRIETDGYELIQVAVYDALTDETNELRALFSDNIAEYFLSQRDTKRGSGISGEVDQRAVVHQNGNGYSEVQAGGKAERLDNRVPQNGVGGRREAQGLRSGGFGIVETRTLEVLINDESFKKLSNFIGDEISLTTFNEISTLYENDDRTRIFDFSDIITYDALTDETNELRALFSDNIAEYFLSQRDTKRGSGISGEVDADRKVYADADERSEVQSTRGTGTVYSGLHKAGDRERRSTRIYGRDGRGIEERTLEVLVKDKRFTDLTLFVGDEISYTIFDRIYDNYQFDPRIETDGYELIQVAVYDALTNENNELRELFSDNIAEYFGERRQNTDSAGNAVSNDILNKTADSVVKNEKGQLIAVYHSTDKVFSRFNAGDIGIHFGSFAQAKQRAIDKNIANPIYVKAYLNITNPLVIDEDFVGWNAFQIAQKLTKEGILTEEEAIKYIRAGARNSAESNSKLVSVLKAKGYDGIIYNNAVESMNGKAYLVFDDNQVIRVEIGAGDKENITTSDTKGKIAKGMSDAERFEILSKKSIVIPMYNQSRMDAVTDIDISKLSTVFKKEAKPILKRLGEEFGIFKAYTNEDIELEFDYSRRSFHESVNKQEKRYSDFAKMLTVFDAVIENAVGIEVHSDKYAGTSRADSKLTNTYVLISGFRDGEGIIPVKLTVKELEGERNKLHLAISAKKIEAEISAQAFNAENTKQKYAPSASSEAEISIQTSATQGNRLKYTPSASVISLSDLLGNVKDESLRKYIPKQFFETQKAAVGSQVPYGNQNAPQPTSETTSSTASNDAISEKSKNVNTNSTQNGGKYSDGNSDMRLSIEPDFENRYDNWVESGRRSDITLKVGRTSEALKSIGVKDQDIIWNTGKINSTLRKHQYLNDGILKQIPSVLENPIVVMQSKQSDSRLTMFGELYDSDGLPIMVVIELLPTNRVNEIVLDNILIVSTHSRKSNTNSASISQTQSIINSSDILYIDPNKNRTNNWMAHNRLQLPLGQLGYGSIKKVTYPDGNVNTNSTQNGGKYSDESGNMRLSIEPDFENRYDNWVENGRRNNIMLKVGTTSEALKSIGVKDQDIIWNTGKINSTLRKHQYLNDGILKQIPSVLENPIVVMQSKQSDSRLTMFGELYDPDGLPIMVVIELLPTDNRNEIILDNIVIVSTHSRKSQSNASSISQTQSMINSSDILYIDPNKNRTNNWMAHNRLQLPLGQLGYGSIKKVTYPDGNVNTNSTQNGGKYSDESSDMRLSVDGDDLSVSTNGLRQNNALNDLNDARKRFVKFVSEHFPKSIVNKNTGETIDISRNGIDKFLSGNISYEKYASGYAIPKLIETAEKVGEAENKKGKSGITGYSYYHNTLKIDGVEYSAHIRVRNTTVGDKYYGHTVSKNVVDIEIEPLAWGSENSENSINAADSTVDTIVSQDKESVNDSIGESGGKYSEGSSDVKLSRDDEIFVANKKSVQEFSEQIDKWMRGEMDSEEYFKLGNTPAVLSELGAKRLPIVMSQDVIVKITGEKHSIAVDDIKEIPNALADPIMIFKSDTIDNAFVVLTTLTDKSGNDVVVALHLNKLQKRLRINRISSVYGKNNVQKFVETQIRKGNLKYMDKIKSQEWATNRGLQLPKLVQSNPDNNIILQKEDVVNKYYAENGGKYSESRKGDSDERNDLLYGSGEWGNNASSGEQAGKLQAYERKIEGRTKEERQSYAEEVRAKGKVRETIVEKVEVDVIEESAFNDEMRSIADKYAKEGIEVGFFIGAGIKAFDSRKTMLINGFTIDGKIYIRYDGDIAPQKLALHEFVHTRWESEGVQSLKEKILSDLTDAERKAILETERYRNYMEIYNGDEDAVWQEFVCDTLASMNEYTEKYIDDVSNYWYEGEGERAVSTKRATEISGTANTSDSDGVRFSAAGKTTSDTSSLKEQLTAAQGELNSMKPVYSQKGVSVTDKGRAKNLDILMKIFEAVGYRVEHPGVGEIILDKKRISNSLRYMKTNGELAVYGALPSVIQKGIIIHNKADHKGRGYGSLTIAAPVEINGQRGNVAVAIRKDSGSNYYKVHRILMPDGSSFLYEKDSSERAGAEFDNETVTSPAEAVYNDNIPSATKIIAVVGSKPLGMLSNNNVSQNETVVNGRSDSSKREAVAQRGENSPYLRTAKDGGTDISETNDFSNDNISNRKQNVNGEIKFSFEGKEGYDFDAMWDKLLDEYDAIEKGEKPARDIDVPKKISEKEVVSEHARTLMEAGVTPDWAIPEFQRMVMDGSLAHFIMSNDKAQEWANKFIEREGFEDALKAWDSLVKTGKVGKREIALGQILYNQCITNKDAANAMKIACELATEETRAGQVLQAARMLKMMGPDGELYYLEKSIQKMNEEFRNRLGKGKRFRDIVLDEQLVEQFLTEKDETKRSEIKAKLVDHIAMQIPATFKEKWDSWRYMAMLTNPLTHVRNMSSNAVMWGIVRIKNFVAAGMEEVLERAGRLKKEDRTKSFNKSKEAVEFAKKDFLEMEQVLQGVDGKYALTSDIESRRKIFKPKVLEIIRKGNSGLLEIEDMVFLKDHYVDALARLITARGLDVSKLSGKALENARLLAVKEAQESTYRDANIVAETFNKWKRGNLAEKAVATVSDAVMPFKKTPMNIAKQGVLYSPGGLLTGTYKLIRLLRDGKYTSADVVNEFAKAFTGTALVVLGWWLASMGLLSGSGDDEEKKNTFDKMTGKQEYAFQIGDRSFTISWATPACMPLLVGAEINGLMEGKDLQFRDVFEATSKVLEPLLELSVFKGLSDVIESTSYNETDPLSAAGLSMVESYFMQALPSITARFASLVDDKQRDYYYNDKDSPLPAEIQSIIGQISSKLPFPWLREKYAVKVDDWGREKTYGGIVERAIENFVSPGYWSKENLTEVDKELKALYERCEDPAIFPVKQTKYYTSGGEKYYMDAETYYKVKKVRGQKSYELLAELFDSELYFDMTDEEKVAAISKCYTEAGKITKEEMLEEVMEKAG